LSQRHTHTHTHGSRHNSLYILAIQNGHEYMFQTTARTRLFSVFVPRPMPRIHRFQISRSRRRDTPVPFVPSLSAGQLSPPCSRVPPPPSIIAQTFSLRRRARESRQAPSLRHRARRGSVVVFRLVARLSSGQRCKRTTCRRRRRRCCCTTRTPTDALHGRIRRLTWRPPPHPPPPSTPPSAGTSTRGCGRRRCR